MDKSPDAFRTISEVADDLRLPQHVLRFWETRFPQIRPLKRGGGRRYYRPDDVDLLKGIRHLLYGEGYTIKGVQRILKEEGSRFVQSVGRGEQQVAAPPEGRAAHPEEGTGVPARDGAAGVFEPATGGAIALRAEPRPPAAGLLASGDLQRLRAVLLELEECDRVLGSLKAPADAHLVE
ncbi:MAG TPA: MerR family transcriptional regulator [Microvirga sp.]|jgi:DNA-binding transcriptional MerR regulator|nr:MerR family transcriptional regulator [Microvirga sp.]